MKNPFVRWNNEWPVLSVKPELLLAAARQKAAQAAVTQQVSAKQEWDAEGGTIKPPIIAGPKLPL